MGSEKKEDQESVKSAETTGIVEPLSPQMLAALKKVISEAEIQAALDAVREEELDLTREEVIEILKLPIKKN